MAENIFKVYKDGAWYKDTDQQRYDHVVTALDRYRFGDYDWLDLVWHIKNAVIGNIFFSEEVFQGIVSGQYWPNYKTLNKDHSIWIERIIRGQTMKSSNSLDEELLKIRERLNWKCSNGFLRFEHMIPAKVYLDHLVEKRREGTLNIQYFNAFRKKINVCIITKQEDDRLNNAGLRQIMPPGWNWNTGAVNCRYLNVTPIIKIHNWPYNP